MIDCITRIFAPLCVTMAIVSNAIGDGTQTKKDDEQLRNALFPLLTEHRGEVSVAIKNLESGETFSFNADTVRPTASLIKLPLMVATYQLVDQGKVDLSEEITLQQSDKTPGSGVLSEHFTAGIGLPLKDYIRLMIRYSDNTATNIITDKIGLRTTADAMSAIGLENTKLHSKLYQRGTSLFPQRSQAYGIGSTTANEMVELLAKLHDGSIANEGSVRAMREHLLACEDDTKLAAELPQNVRFAHKTGAIANCRTDAGIIYTSNGPIAVCFLTTKNLDHAFTAENEANQLAARVGQAIIDRFGDTATDNRLREGAYGTLVESLQRTLNARLEPSPQLAIDGDFGPATKRAVERFQRVHKLEIDGIVTAPMWKALGTLIEEDDPVPTPEQINSELVTKLPQPDATAAPIVTCKAWGIADFDTGQILHAYNANTALHPASTTKIMTAFVVLRYAESDPSVLDERIEFSAVADNTIGSTSGIRIGESVTVRELLYGLLLPSGNDASVALAESFGSRIANASNTNANQSFNQFVHAMNTTARDIGMNNTHFKNPHGLTDEEHLTTAADLIVLARAAMNYKLFREIVATPKFGCVAISNQGYRRNILWVNTNRLLGIEGYTGVKTGTTSAAGSCLVSCGQRNGDQLIAVVLGSSSSAARYSDTRNLLRWTWLQRSKTSLPSTGERR